MKSRSGYKIYLFGAAVVIVALTAYFLHRSFYLYGQRLTASADVLQQGHDLAQRHCGGCHLVPVPAAHSPRIWNHVLVQMGFRLGHDTFDMHGYFPEDQTGLRAERDLLIRNPGKPQLSKEDLRTIRNYYLVRSPSEFQPPEKNDSVALRDAKIVPLRVLHGGPFAVTAALSQTGGELWLGEGVSKRLFRFDATGASRYESALPDMPVSLQSERNRLQIGFIGSMFPSDDKKGKVMEYVVSPAGLAEGRVLASGLYRTAQATVHPNGEVDAAGFGNTQGEFSVINARGEKQTIYQGSGAIWSRRVSLFGTKPQLLVLVAQEKEELILFEKNGNQWQRAETLIKLTPESGTMQFHVADMNGDGRQDIVLISGDDGDLPGESPRAYHGVRIFFQDAHHKFSERYFFNFPGAYRGCVADFNRDGISDIAAASYYPAPNTPHFALLILLGQKDSGYKPYRIDTEAAARFITLDCTDADGNGRPDLLLGKGDLKGPEKKGEATTIGYFIPNPF